MENIVSPLISLIIPIYNIEQYLKKCIESVLNQTYTNLEIILINDGSTDSSYSICTEYKDKRIKLISTENRGLSSARNIGLENATGTYISFIDGDDYVHNNYISLLYKTLIKYNADISLCHFLKGTSSELENQIPNSIFTNQEYSISGVEGIKKILIESTHENYVVSWGKLYKKELFEDITFPIGKYNEDSFVTYKLYNKTNIISYVNAPLYYYVQRPESIMGSKISIKRYDQILGAKENLEFCIHNNLYISEATKFYLFRFRRFLYEYKLAHPQDCTTIKKLEEEYNTNYLIYREYLPQQKKINLFFLTKFPHLYFLAVIIRNIIKKHD